MFQHIYQLSVNQLWELWKNTQVDKTTLNCVGKQMAGLMWKYDVIFTISTTYI